MDDNLWEYTQELKKQWGAQPKLKDRELLEVFPEAKQIIPVKILELMSKRERLVKKIEKGLVRIKKKKDPMLKFLLREFLKAILVEDLIKLDSRISKLSRLNRLACGYTSERGISDDMIEGAKQVPIEDLINRPFRVSGQRKVFKCPLPLHEEKTPSFFVFEDNHYYCFGCHQSGSSIDFVMKTQGLTFPEAVKFLTGGRK